MRFSDLLSALARESVGNQRIMFRFSDEDGVMVTTSNAEIFAEGRVLVIELQQEED